MIDRVIIKNYRCLDSLDIRPNACLNIIVGDNESGKSTLLEAISLALTCKVNGRWAQEELNPFWFHQPYVAEFFAKYGTPDQSAPPCIYIELYLTGTNDLFQRLRGVHNSRNEDCPGIRLAIMPSEEYNVEFQAYMQDSPPAVLPVEFYNVDWRDFSDTRLHQRPKELATSFIDSRTIRSTSGVDYHTREMLSEHLDSKERARISLAHRRSRQEITDGTLAAINVRIAEASSLLHHRPIGLQMDQSSRTSWETGIVPQVDDIPFAMSGQGQQAAVKVALAMSRTAGTSTFVLVEEPENHLSHTSLTRLVRRIEDLAQADQQLFISTHSSFVLNRLGIDKLLLLHAGRPLAFTGLTTETVQYFRKLAGYDTLRLVLANRAVLVEGPSDAIIFERAFRDAAHKLPSEAGIDIVSMNGLTFKRALELCKGLDRQAVALQDNDGRDADDIIASVSDLLSLGQRELFVGPKGAGNTLESQIVAANDEQLLRRILCVPDQADLLKWMLRNKTEGALRILESEESITFPSYINDAVARLL